MSRRTSRIPRPSRRERRFWAQLALLLIPLAVWAAARAAGSPPLLAAYAAGIASGLVLAPMAARAGRRLARWAHAAIPAPAPTPAARKEGTAK